MSDAERPPINRSGIALAEDGTFLVARAQVGHCFGCGPTNPHGLRLRFRVSEDAVVSTTVDVADHLCGVEGVVHGGIQATIFDEVCGVAAQLALPPDAGDAPCVTAELSLRFRQAVPQVGPVTAEARVVRREGRSVFVEGAIVDAAGTQLTVATSRWVQLS